MSDYAEQDRLDPVLAVTLMRVTGQCAGGSHCWPRNTTPPVGAPCQCGQVKVDQSMRDTLDWRCEP